MFYLCSTYRVARGGVESLLVLVLAAHLFCAPVAAQTGAQDRKVTERREAMRAARAHVTILEDMASGAVPHDVRAARAARRALIGFSKSIPGLFRRARMDTVTRASPEIWRDPKGFVARANGVLRAARQVRTGNVETLGASLPGLVGACLACHSRFRERP